MDDKPRRPADLAVHVSIMHEELFRLVHKTGYQQPDSRHHHPGADAELMRVSRYTAVATRQGKELTIIEIAKALAMPESNVKRHMRVLIRRKRVMRVVDGRYPRYVADLDVLDLMMQQRALAEEALAIISRCHRDYERTLLLLSDQLIVVFLAIGPYLSRLARVSPLII